MNKIAVEIRAALLAVVIVIVAVAMLRAQDAATNRPVGNSTPNTIMTTNVVTILVTNVVTVMVTNIVTNVVNVAKENQAPAPKAVTVVAATPKVAPKPKTVWNTEASLGLTLTRGNSDTLLAAGKITADRKNDVYEVSLEADAAYGENNNVLNAEMGHGSAQYNQLLTPRNYVYGHLDALHDAVADLNYRFTISSGMGHYLIKDKQTSLSAEAGPGVVIACQNTDSKTYATMRLAENLQHQLNDHVKIWENAEVLPDVEDAEEFVINSEVGVESALTKKTGLRVYLDDYFNNQPSAGRVPNDIKLVSALSYKF